MPASTSMPPRNARQRTVLEILRRAHGAEVTYDQLRDAGVEFPASVVSELERAGVPVERCHGGRRHRQASCRLIESEPDRVSRGEASSVEASPGQASRDEVSPVEASPSNRPPQTLQYPPTEWGSVQIYGAGRRWDFRPPALSQASPGRVMSALALLAGVVIVGFLVLSSMNTGASPVAHRAHSSQTASSSLPPTRHITPQPPRKLTHHPSHRPAPPAPAPASTPAPPQPATPAALEARGHALLEAGQYISAIPVLREAAQTTGESATACAQPTTQNCLTYAYALFDLGRALRLSGDPSAAVPILQQRLQINNQRGVVAQELALAQGSASHPSATALEARGHQLLESGAYTSAIPVLQQAVQATGENAGACAQPTSQNCLTYAYALFDLGRALRLSGNPSAAIPILKTRLQINNQRGVVAQELQLAESGAQA